MVSLHYDIIIKSLSVFSQFERLKEAGNVWSSCDKISSLSKGLYGELLVPMLNGLPYSLFIYGMKFSRILETSKCPTTSMSCRNFQRQSCQLCENKIVNFHHTADL